MKNLIIALSILLLSVSYSTAQYIPVPAGSSISLNGTWKFNPSPDRNVYESSEFHSGWKDIQVPGEWIMQGFQVKKGDRAAYQTRFTVPEEWSGKRIILRFDAVYSDAIVWLNGKKAASHTGGFNVFEADVTALLKKGLNCLTVGVMSESIADTLSCGSQYAAHPLGGIPRKVTLFPVPDFHISDIFIKTDLDEQYMNARLQIELAFRNSNKGVKEGKLQIDLISPEGKIVAGKLINLAITDFNELSENITLDVLNPLKWNAEYPNLYKLRIELTSSSGKEVIEKNVGFRELEIAGNQLFLNGAPVKLHGVNRHEVHPLTGRSLNMELWKKDALLYKAANVNYIRTSHYPPAEEFISLCDSIGLYVELENPLVWIGHNANLSLKFNDAWDIRLRRELLKTTRETVTYYRNHPGIIIWSLANESAWTDNWKAAQQEADSLDPTRPKTFHDQAYGIYNNYGSVSMPIANMHYPGPKGPEVAETFERPLLFGEYCHLNTYNRQEIATDPGVRDTWVQGFYRMWEKMYRTKGCLGGALWSGIDDAFMLPEGKLVGYGEWGPIDGWRRMKPEYYHVRKTYCPVIIGNRKASLTDGNEILLQVENRFDFTNLKDCRFEWEVAGQKGISGVDVAPHNSGILKISPLAGKINGQILGLKIYSPYNLLIDESSVEIGEVNHEYFPFGSASVETISKTEDLSAIHISGGDLNWTFDKAKGKIILAVYRKDTVLNNGAELMILPLHSQECKTEHSLNIPFINSTCLDWKVNSVVSSVVNDTVNITVKGTYKEAEITLDYYFLKAGMLSIKYSFTATEDVNPRQVGLVFSVPGSNKNMSWYRKGFWSSYPGWHIGRTVGQAVPFPNDAFYLTRFGVKPEGEWRLDANSLGTNDFRSTKNNVYWAALTNADGIGIAAISDGTASYRSWVKGNSVNFLIADYSNGGAEIFFASHLESERRPLNRGDKFEGLVTLKIVSAK
ncbi:MAG: glycoside hydrolase family 2 [Bacteroidales bacterium]|nr:glycoside hydrolase family 2 [Bacteroidales bacterium]